MSPRSSILKSLCYSRNCLIQHIELQLHTVYHFTRIQVSLLLQELSIPTHAPPRATTTTHALHRATSTTPAPHRATTTTYAPPLRHYYITSKYTFYFIPTYYYTLNTPYYLSTLRLHHPSLALLILSTVTPNRTKTMSGGHQASHKLEIALAQVLARFALILTPSRNLYLHCSMRTFYER